MGNRRVICNPGTGRGKNNTKKKWEGRRMCGDGPGIAESSRRQDAQVFLLNAVLPAQHSSSSILSLPSHTPPYHNTTTQHSPARHHQNSERPWRPHHAQQDTACPFDENTQHDIIIFFFSHLHFWRPTAHRIHIFCDALHYNQALPAFFPCFFLFCSTQSAPCGFSSSLHQSAGW